MGKHSPSQVYWAYMLERNISDLSADNLSVISTHATAMGARRLRLTYGRTDLHRNLYELSFLGYSRNRDDWLVMLDQDHVHPENIIERLTANRASEIGVVAALAFRRTKPWSPCCFIRDSDGFLNAPESWEPGLHQVTIAGTGAIAIRRWVFAELLKKGWKWPHWRYEYKATENLGIWDSDGELKPEIQIVNDMEFPSEDCYFSAICDKAGIPLYVDFSIISPHMITETIDDKPWKAWLQEHPDKEEYLELMTVPDGIKNGQQNY